MRSPICLRSRLALLTLCVLAAFTRAQPAPAPRLVFDAAPEKQKEPHAFRTAGDPLKKTDGPVPSRDGLDGLRVSGSASFSEEGLRKITDRIPTKKIIVVDLRQESHGLLNGLAVEWWDERNAANKGKSLEQIVEDERTRLAALCEAGKATVLLLDKSEKLEADPTALALKSVQSEQELCKARDLGYVRIPVTDREKPADDAVDRVLQLVRGLPEDGWLHFHCKAGNGRTTSFLTMVDMMRNAKKVSRDDIFLRQKLLGGADLTDDGPKTDWRYEGYVARRRFLEKFYDYCKANDDGFKTTWSEWSAKQAK